jgi:signal transduction histidine kinase
MSELHFKISTGLKSIIGKDLITDEFIAIYELVKNSFDAYATRVDIRFERDEIIIQDNGKGMTFEDLRDKWLFVAYSAKKEGSEDESTNDSFRDYRSNLSATRYYAGAKGIGRFSCDRLGSELVLYSRVRKAQKVEKLEVDWRRFEKDAEEKFETIAIEHESLPVSTAEKEIDITGYKHGTVVRICGLYNIWNREKIKQLRRALTKLINPFDENTGNNSGEEFRIFLHASEFIEDDEIEEEPYNRVNGEVTNSVIELVKLKSTSIHVKIDKSRIHTTIEDRGILIYEVEEDNTLYDKLHSVEIYLYFLNTAAKTNFTRRMGLRPIDFGSVFLFKNGFRIYPFGEPGDDRLGIDERKQQGYNRFIGSRDLLGRIEIHGDAENLDFRETSSRDGGLVATIAYEQLKDSVRETALAPLEKYVAGILWYVADKTDEELIARRDKDRNTEAPFLVSHLDVRAEVADLLSNLTRGKKNAVLLNYDASLLKVKDDEVTPNVTTLIDKLSSFAEKVQDKTVIKNLSLAKQHIGEINAKLEAETLLRLQEEDARRHAEKAKQEALARARQAEADAKAEQMENTLLKSTAATGLEEVISLHHHIGISSDTISKILAGLYRKIKSPKEVDADYLVHELNKISFENSKIHAVTQFATKANFVMNSDEIERDIARFIADYVTNISSIAFTQLDITVNNNSNSKFVRKFKPIEISMVVDNIISNSRKARARNVVVELDESSENRLKVKFTDDGNGVPHDIREQIFKFGFTTTRGSGLGLHHVQKILTQMGATIELNQSFHPGTQFVITF